MQMARLTRPLAPQRTYGNQPAPFTANSGAMPFTPAPTGAQRNYRTASMMPYAPLGPSVGGGGASAPFTATPMPYIAPSPLSKPLGSLPTPSAPYGQPVSTVPVNTPYPGRSTNGPTTQPTMPFVPAPVNVPGAAGALGGPVNLASLAQPQEAPAPLPYAPALTNSPSTDQYPTAPLLPYTPSPVPARPSRTPQAEPSFLNAPGEQPVPTAATPAGRAQNFQRSLNLQRATTADRARTFAKNSPLPMDENGVYNGAFGKGDDAHQRALGARQGYLDEQAKVSDAQNWGQGQGFNEGQQLRQDWNTRENGDAAAAGGFTSKDFANMSKADRDRAVADRIRQLTPGQVEGQGVRNQYTRDRSDALKNDQDRKAAYNPDLTRMTRDNAGDIVRSAMAAHRDLVTELNTATRALQNPGLDPDTAASVQTRIANLEKEERIARAGVDKAVKRAEDLRNGVVNRTSGARPTTQPATQPGATPLTHDQAFSILSEAGGDKEKARQIAKSRGLSF